MKKIFYLLGISFLFSLSALAQNEGINFQGLARNAAGEVLVSQKINLRLSILLGSESGTIAYTETRQTSTNPQGIFAVVVGDGTANSKSGNFSTIDWGTASKFIKVEMDPNAGTNFITMGTSKLQPVPFAFFAYGVDAENVQGIVPVGSGGTGVASMAELKTSLGVDQVNNTSDANKPLSTAATTALATKVDKVSGKELSTNDYTTADKTKLAAISGTNTGDQDLSAYATTTQLATKANASDVSASLATKVDKEIGKGLSSNDFTTAEKTKLAAISGNVAGPQGIQGLPGPAGAIGPIGLTGPAGLTGATGPAGPQGLPGAIGPAGNDGAVGPQGATGPAGLPGLQGQAGAAGVAGPAGPQGLPGPIGLTGPAGVTGPIGLTGPAGPQGLQGATGPAGTNGVSASSANFVDLTTDQTIAGVKTFSGNIGMGTSTPSAKFEIVGGTRNDMLRLVSDGNPSVSFKNTDPSGGAANDGEYQLFAAGNSGNPSINPGTFGIYYDHSSNAGYRMAITNTGNVGVGTAKPTEKLDVVGNLKTSGTIKAGTITYPNTAGTNGYYLKTDGTGTASWAAISGGGVPYTGATGAVNLGGYDLTVNELAVGSGKVGTSGSSSNTIVGGAGVNRTFTTVLSNTAIGYNTMSAAVPGNSNTAVGAYSLVSTTGRENSVLGVGAMERNLGGNENTAIGYYAMQNNLSGSGNTALGFKAGFSSDNTTVNNATAIGYQAKVAASNTIQLGADGTNGTTAITNVKTSGTITAGAITYPNTAGTNGQVLTSNGSGTASWAAASGGVPYTGATGAVNLGAYDLTVNGVTVGKGQANITDNTAVGLNALNSASSSGGGNSAFGYQALQANTTGGNSNSALGYKALTANTTGYNNTAIGASSLLSNTIGFNNIGIGASSLIFNTEGDYNIGVGAGALQQNKLGNTNIAIGREAGFHLNSYNFSSGTGSGNIFIGFQSGISRNRGSNNTAIGQQSLYSYTVDFYDYSNAVAIGIQSGFTNTTNNNTFLGSFADVDYTINSSITNATAVGYQAKVVASNSIQLGNTAVTNVKTSGTLTAGDVTYPKTHGTANQVLSTTGSGVLTWTTPATSSAHYIGEAYGGGIVFYVWDNGAHGLIAATSDQGAVRWGADLSSTRARADGVGSGLTNTAIIIAKQGTVDSNLIAASLCNEYSVTSGGVVYGGWYLPSKHELQLLFNQKNILTGLTGDWYYSSTESASGDAAWLINGNGSSSSWWPNDKREAWSVRAIRAF